MPQLYSKRELSTHAINLARTYSLIRANNVLYLPADFETGDFAVTPEPDRTVWRPLTMRDVQQWALAQYDVLFSATSEEANFFFMVGQVSQQMDVTPDSLLIHTEEGLRELKSDGKLHIPTGKFIPNYLSVKLNTDQADKQQLRDVFHSWLDNEEEELSLLRHLSTALSPSWSAVKYLLLLGDGRNGKSLLMSMLQGLFGWANCSHVTRQDVSKSSPVVTEVQNKLLNIVYDGVAEYLKDSGNEKSLIAGEPVSIRMLYSSQSTMVATNALFVEGLNREPKSGDKSSALQARLVRFWFPNVFQDDLIFKDRMMSERMLGALLSLLIDNYVQKTDKAVMLAPTARSQELSMEHMHANSFAMQFIAHVDTIDPMGADALINGTITELAARFQAWRLAEGDINPWSEPSIFELFRPFIVFDRKSLRVHGQIRKTKTIAAFKPSVLRYLEYLKGGVEDAAAIITALVED